jgi:cytochrome c peroxidase
MNAGRWLGLLGVMIVPVAWPADSLSDIGRLGKLLFSDASLSASGRQSCASCHDPANAFAAPRTAGVVMYGGPALDQPGLRTVPSLRYLDHTPRFTRHYYVSSARESEDRGPTGGFMRDGRADNLRAQALLPLLDPVEMANSNVAQLARRLRATPYFSDFRQLYGAERLLADDELVDHAAEALERYQLEDPAFHPYSSRYDQFLAGKLELSAQELRGLRLFVDPAKGNCAACHPQASGVGGRAPAFTDFSFHALGVPRNPGIPANAERQFFDLGLCGPRRLDLQAERNYCGFFKTPSLRNVARRRFLFHNGRATTLAEAVRFYVERDRLPQLWYPRVAGAALPYDDLPVGLRGNVNSSDAPFNWRTGEPPPLDAAEVEDLVAFLQTLSDTN